MNTLIALFTRLVFGSDPHPDFYYLLSQRTLPKLDQSALELRERVEANLRRDALCKRIFVVSIPMSFMALFLCAFFASDPDELARERIAEKQQQFNELKNEAEKIYVELKNDRL